MLPVCHGDVVAVARVLRAAPRPLRAVLASAFVTRAGWADRFRQETGTVHNLWGNGSLQSVVSNYRRCAEPSLEDRDYLGCVMLVIQALLARPPSP